jgi:hypothetical protein
MWYLPNLYIIKLILIQSHNVMSDSRKHSYQLTCYYLINKSNTSSSTHVKCFYHIWQNTSIYKDTCFCLIQQNTPTKPHVYMIFNKTTLLPGHMFLCDMIKHSYQGTCFYLIQQNTPTKTHVSIWFNKTLLPSHMFLTDSTKHSYQGTCFCLIQQNTPTKAHVSNWFNKECFVESDRNMCLGRSVLLNQTETCGLVGVFCWIR